MYSHDDHCTTRRHLTQVLAIIELIKKQSLTIKGLGHIYYAGGDLILLVIQGLVMDKDVLAIIGKLYLDTFTLNNYVESLKSTIAELESKLAAVSTKKNGN